MKIKYLMIESSRIFLCAMACAASVSMGNASDYAIVSYAFSPDETLEPAEGQTSEFVDGPFEGSKALHLSYTDHPQSGLATTINAGMLEEGTMEIWFKPEDGALNRSVLVNLGSGGNMVVSLSLEEGTIRGSIVIKDDPQPRSIYLKGPEVTGNEWHHTAISWSPESGVRLYFNGERVDEVSDPAVPWTLLPEHPLYIGDRQDYREGEGQGWFETQNNFIGAVAHLKISDVSLQEFPEVKKKR